MADKICIKGEQHLRYNLKIWKNDAFDIIHDISVKFSLAKLMDTLGNVNYAIRIDGYWTFDSNYEKHFV